MKVGRFYSGVFRALLTQQYLTLGAQSVPHQVYEVRVKTAPMTLEGEMEVVRKLLKIYVEGMEVLGVEAKGDMVKIQVTGSPFFWSGLLLILPQIIVPLIALVVGLVIVFRIPEWAYAALPIGIGGAVLLYALVKTRK